MRELLSQEEQELQLGNHEEQIIYNIQQAHFQ